MADIDLEALSPSSLAGTDVAVVRRGAGPYSVELVSLATDLTYTAATRVLASSTGTDATLPLVASGAAGLAPASGGGTANFLRADGTWAAPPGGSSYTEPGPTRFYTFNDFNANGSVQDWTMTVTGTGTSSYTLASADGSGIGWIGFTTGAATNSRLRMVSPRFDGVNFSNGAARFRARMRTDDLSDATETYTTRIGFIDSDTGETTDGAFFRYTHSVNGGRWQAVTRAANVETAVDTGVTVAANTIYTLDVQVSGGTATFLLDGVSVATISTNVPSGSGQPTGYGFFMLKTAGTTARSMRMDYGSVEQILTGRL